MEHSKNKQNEKSKPSSTSTPNNSSNRGRLYRRRSIHGEPDTQISPIQKSFDSHSEPSDCENDYDTISRSSHQYSSRSKSTQSYDYQRSSSESESQSGMLWWMIVGTFLIVLLIFISAGDSSEEMTVTINNLKIDFPSQSDFFWKAIETGIDEVKVFEKPSVFLLLQEPDAENISDAILMNVAKYATCVLNNDCKLQPIILTDANITSEKALKDYGHFIDKYKYELEKKSVMIVKNLDKVPGTIAQAFHSLCDEYSPLVRKSVFFFTMRIDDYKRVDKTDIKVAEDILKDKWNNLKDDIFYPLFTRISSMVLKIVTE